MTKLLRSGDIDGDLRSGMSRRGRVARFRAVANRDMAVCGSASLQVALAIPGMNGRVVRVALYSGGVQVVIHHVLTE